MRGHHTFDDGHTTTTNSTPNHTAHSLTFHAMPLKRTDFVTHNKVQLS
jgi:hypothetical protein